MTNFIQLPLLKIAAVGIVIFSSSVSAADIRQIQLERSGAYMSGSAKMVNNPKNIPCNSVKDCREKGQDLDTVSQFEGSDYSASQYPGPCRRASAKGYVFHPSKC